MARPDPIVLAAVKVLLAPLRSTLTAEAEGWVSRARGGMALWEAMPDVLVPHLFAWAKARPLPRSVPVKMQRNICGPAVARLRKRGGMSQAELGLRCRKAGWPVARSVLAKVETRRRAVSDYELVALAAALGVRVEKLLGMRRA